MVDRAGSSTERLTVFYDGACPICVRDRRTYEKLAGERDNVCWVDITAAEAQLREAGIDPRKALTELHVQDGEGNIFSEIDAYRLADRVAIGAPDPEQTLSLVGSPPVNT
jgi:predicted DCC family thiol-disulfide oxidoreductase YuxK